MNKKEIYFDNSATTRCFPEVAALVSKIMLEDYGNPSSKHRKGLEAEKYVIRTGEQIAESLRVKPKEIIFTSGGTESNNMALFCAAEARKRQGMHIITSAIEHAAVYKPLDRLAEMGYEVTSLPVDGKGHISLEDLRAAIRPDTILVSIMYVNNEIGAVEPVAEIGRIIKERNPGTLFHTDAIQAYGKVRIRPKEDGIDLLSASAHKFHGPKGAGFLYVDERLHLKPLIYGGGQQAGMRSGTHNVPGIAGMGLAAEMVFARQEEYVRKIRGIRNHFMEMLRELDGVRINSEEGEDGAPQIVSASFEGIRAEVLLHALEDRGIFVGSGSACSSNHPGISGTLKAIGLPQRLLDSTLRFSFSIYNEPEEAEECVRTLSELLPMLRRYRRA